MMEPGIVRGGCSPPLPAALQCLVPPLSLFILLLAPICLCLLGGWASEPDVGLQWGSKWWWCEGVGTQTDAAIPGEHPQEEAVERSSCPCAPPESMLGRHGRGWQMAAPRPPAPLPVVPRRPGSAPLLLRRLPTPRTCHCSSSAPNPTFASLNILGNALLSQF